MPTNEERRGARNAAHAILTYVSTDPRVPNAVIAELSNYVDRNFPPVKRTVENIITVPDENIPGYPAGPYQFRNVDGRLEWRVTNVSGRAATEWEPCNIAAGLLPAGVLRALGDVLLAPTIEVDDDDGE